MSVKIEEISEPLTLGEGPHWDDQQQALFFVSILDHTVHKYDLNTRKHTKSKMDGTVSFIIPIENYKDYFIVGLGRKLVIIQWDGCDEAPVEIIKELHEVDKISPRNRFNDAKVDPRGRLFAGTMGHEESPGKCEKDKGVLYCLKDNSLSQVTDKLGISNGLSWDLKEKAFYFTDSLEKKIRRYDYDVQTGAVSNLKYIFDLKENDLDGFPDGHVIDTDGNLWITLFGGFSIIKIDPRSGKLLQKVIIPAKNVTSATFGGPNYDILFVTSANVDKHPLPSCGCTFMITGLGVKGLPNNSFKHNI